jgi:hypothetical protein
MKGGPLFNRIGNNPRKVNWVFYPFPFRTSVFYFLGKIRSQGKVKQRMAKRAKRRMGALAARMDHFACLGPPQKSDSRSERLFPLIALAQTFRSILKNHGVHHLSAEQAPQAGTPIPLVIIRFFNHETAAATAFHCGLISLRREGPEFLF